MKNFGLVVLSGLILTALVQSARADETNGEKAAAAGNTASRSMKKGANRVKEAFCMEGDLKCAGNKVKNRAVETKDSVVDGAKEAGNKID